MNSETEFLRKQVADLTARVWRLEQVLNLQAASADSVPAAAPVLQAEQSSDRQQSIPTVSVSAPVDAQPVQLSKEKQSHSSGSLESRIGSQIFNRVGILAVLIGMAWFLKFAIDNHWIGPLGRIVVGLLSGVALIAWSERFRGKGYSAFSYSLKAIGSGVLYLSLWAAFDLYHFISAGAAFAAMIAVTAWNGFICWVQDSELLALYAIVGGFSTPLLLSTGENHELMLFGYLLVLDLAVLILIALRPWSRLLLGAFAGTIAFGIGWYSSFYSDAQFALTAFFLLAFFVLFAIAPRLLHGLQIPESSNLSMQDNLVVVLLPLANATFSFLGFYILLESAARRWEQPWAAVLFAAFYLLLLRLPARDGAKTPAVLSSLHLAIAVVFLTIAIPLEAHGRWITIGWLAEGVVLLWLAHRLSLFLLRVLSLGALTLGFVGLIILNSVVSATVLFNARFATYLAGIAAFGISAWIAKQATHAEERSGNFPWAYIAGGAIIAVNVLVMVAFCFEIHSYWWSHFVSGEPWSAFVERRMYAQFTYSAWTMLFGATLLTIGFWRKTAFLRWQALVLIAGSIGKVFLVDTSQLSQGYRILSFLGLGVLLLAVSFAYQRDWLSLRKAQQEKPAA